MSPHELLNPNGLTPAVGFSHVVLPASGRLVFLAGQAAHLPDGTIEGESMVEQFETAARNVVTALEAAGAASRDLVSMQIFVTDMEEYRASRRAIGRVYRKAFGGHYPAVSLFEVEGLFDPLAKVELVCVAVASQGG
ncbi:MAG: RidA family protein [Acidimicrobiia bacterium]